MTRACKPIDALIARMHQPGPIDDSHVEPAYDPHTWTSADDREYAEDDARASDRYEKERGY